jgi:hypothetical protein
VSQIHHPGHHPAHHAATQPNTTQRLSPEVMQSLREASAKTGVDFDYLVTQAGFESGFRGNAHAPKGSAMGLFQFTGGTWLKMMHDHGAKYGQADLAKHLSVTRTGAVVAPDKETEKRVLDLRRDDRLSALFAAEYAKNNGAKLEAATGHKANAAELHLAHLLGPNGAVRFLKAHEDNEKQTAAKLMPAAARQNPGLFYARGTHNAQSVAAVYQKIQDRLDVPRGNVAQIPTETLRPALGLSDNVPTTGPRTDRRA